MKNFVRKYKMLKKSNFILLQNRTSGPGKAEPRLCWGAREKNLFLKHNL